MCECLETPQNKMFLFSLEQYTKKEVNCYVPGTEVMSYVLDGVRKCSQNVKVRKKSIEEEVPSLKRV